MAKKGRSRKKRVKQETDLKKREELKKVEEDVTEKEVEE